MATHVSWYLPAEIHRNVFPLLCWIPGRKCPHNILDSGWTKEWGIESLKKTQFKKKSMT